MRIKYLIILSLLVVSCTSQNWATPPAVNTLESQPMTGIINTVTVTPTVTRSQMDRIFVLPTNGPYLIETTPTPISTPADDLPRQLRDLSEEEYVDLIQDMQSYSYQNFPPALGWWPEGMFSASQIPLALVIQEYLYYYPDSPNTERLKWQLAFIDSISYVGGNVYDDNWIISELEARLNQGIVSPENLETILDQYWFEVNYSQPIENLFGDGKTAWLYVIIPQVWEDEEVINKSPDFFGRGGLFVVVREVSDRNYRLFILENALNFSFGSSSIFDISDFNHNGLPEIALDIGNHSGTMCSGGLKIFEWRDTRFAELTGGNITVSDCSDSFQYISTDGNPSIILNKLFTPIPSLYVWNGSSYEFSRYGAETSSLPIREWQAVSLDPHKTFADESESIEVILSSGQKLSPAQIDYLRYRLGITYALDSQVSQAKMVFQELVENPSDKKRVVYSEFAQNFLKYYSGDQSLYLACKKSREILNKTIESLTPQMEEELFGVNADISSPFGVGRLRCFDDDVFNLIISKMPVEIEDLPAELRKNGVAYYFAQKHDVNLDGTDEEWLVIIEGGLYVIYPSGPYYGATELQHFWYGEDVSSYSTTVADVSRWNEIQEPALKLSAAEEILIFSIGPDYNSTRLNSEFDVENASFVPTATPAQFQVSYIKPTPGKNYYGVPWNGYRWDSMHREFRNDLLEYILFVNRDAEKAVKMSDEIFPIFQEWKHLEDVARYLPRYFYLCGLSYELAGDEQRAAQIYWQLWRDFPESPFALMARYKLEPASP